MTNAPPDRSSDADPDAPERLRVMIVCSTLHVGGAEHVAAILASELSRSQFEVIVCCLKENGVVGEEIARRGIPLVELFDSAHRRVDYFTSLKLLREIVKRKISIVHTHDVHGLMDAAICRVLLPRLKHVHTFHFGNYPNRAQSSKRIEQLTWRIPDALVAVGEHQATAISAYYGIDRKRLRVLRNGVDLSEASIAPEVRQAIEQEHRPIIASISTLIPQKGLYDLLDAASILRRSGREFLLLIIGDGHLRTELAMKIDSLGLSENVRLLGWVTEASRRALPSCDIFVQSSHWEAMSVVVLEAMARAKPMVVTRVGENEHVIRDQVDGLLVAPGDAEALAQGLGQLLDDESRARGFGIAARQRYEAMFTSRHMVEGYEALYRSLVNPPTAAPERPRK